MAVDDDYRDFRCYQLKDEGDYEELDVKLEDVKDLFSSDGVFLLVRYDTRRIFIWKGPRSPVRKRFISSRVGGKIQEESSKVGMHLKIVSVDAGDEPVEFLRAFNVKSYEIQDHERPEDMYYVRNIDREKLEEEKLAEELKKNKEGKEEEYWSPILEEEKRLKQMQQAKEEAASTVQEIASGLSNSSKKAGKKLEKSKIKPKVRKRQFIAPPGFNPSKSKSKISNNQEEKEILDMILEHDLPKNKQRLNIIIGNTLYSPKRTISSVFGKEIKEEKWAKILEIPDGDIELDTNMMRIYCNENKIRGIEIFQNDNGKEEKKKENPKSKSKLKAIPSGD
ncbi:MAG: hypothetical protein ACTSVU_01790 [Promethearchaeota archaeon]